MEIGASRFRICRQVRDSKYRFAIWVFPGRHFAHCVNGSMGTVTGLCIIWLKFRMITHNKILVGLHVSKVEPEVEFRR